MTKRQSQPTEPYDTRPWRAEAATARLTDNGMVAGVVNVKDRGARHSLRGIAITVVLAMAQRQLSDIKAGVNHCWQCNGEMAPDAEWCPHCTADAVPF